MKAGTWGRYRQRRATMGNAFMDRSRWGAQKGWRWKPSLHNHKAPRGQNRCTVWSKTQNRTRIFWKAERHFITKINVFWPPTQNRTQFVRRIFWHPSTGFVQQRGAIPYTAPRNTVQRRHLYCTAEAFILYGGSIYTVRRKGLYCTAEAFILYGRGIYTVRRGHLFRTRPAKI